MSAADLALVDPVEMNVIVASDIDSLAHLDLRQFQARVDDWSADFRNRLPDAERQFRLTPDDWKNDIHFFRLGMLCWYLSEVLNIRYIESQLDLQRVLYTNPSDLFLNGLIETREGTCGNMPVLFLAMCWRLGWPVSPFVVNTHMLCRYDNGVVRHNIETTNLARGFRSPPDDYLRQDCDIPQRAVSCGSDLCSMTGRQTLGWYIGLRGRHHQDCGELHRAEVDYLWARVLFPENRRLYGQQIDVGMQLAQDRFDPTERCHPHMMAKWILDLSDDPPDAARWPISSGQSSFAAFPRHCEIRMEGYP